MSQSRSAASKKPKRGFQTQKLYIQKFGKALSPEIPYLERQLADYFGCYGTIIDKKILENGPLIRLQRTVRHCHIFRGGAGPGSPEPLSLLQLLPDHH